MSKYTQSYKVFAQFVLKTHKDHVQQWANDSSNRELQESCKMLLDAAGQG